MPFVADINFPKLLKWLIPVGWIGDNVESFLLICGREVESSTDADFDYFTWYENIVLNNRTAPGMEEALRVITGDSTLVVNDNTVGPPVIDVVTDLNVVFYYIIEEFLDRTLLAGTSYTISL